MLGWLAKLGLGRAPGMDDPDLAQAIERAIYQVEPRLKQAGGYPDRYRPAIARAWSHVRNLAAALPGPVDLNRERFIRDPFVHALFGSPDDIRRALALSPDMRAYQGEAPPVSEAVYALLTLRRSEKTVLGMESHGEVVRREVAQQQVSFSEPRLSCPAATEQETRALIAWSLFDSLVGRVAARVVDLAQARQTLETERDTLMARLRGAPQARRDELRAQLDDLLKRLGVATRQLELHTMNRLFDQELSTPEAHMQLGESRLQLDAMGVVRQPGDPVISHALRFTDLFGLEPQPLTVLVVRCQWEELPPLADRLEAADRLLAL